MANTPFVKRIANFAYEKFTKNPGEFLLISGMIGWAASCFNQTMAIIFNEKIPKEQKYFLIPQEITDGIVNVCLFAVFTRSCTRLGEKLVETGKLLTPKLKKTLVEDFKVGDKIGNIKFNIKELKQMDDSLPEAAKETSEKFRTEFNQFHKGISFAFSTMGSVISYDLVTPFVRNKIASHRQKAALERDKAKQELQLPDVTTNILAQNSLSMDNYRRKASANPLNYSSSMKI